MVQFTRLFLCLINRQFACALNPGHYVSFDYLCGNRTASRVTQNGYVLYDLSSNCPSFRKFRTNGVIDIEHFGESQNLF